MESKQGNNNLDANDSDFEDYAFEFLHQFIMENSESIDTPSSDTVEKIIDESDIFNNDNESIVDQMCRELCTGNETLPDLHVKMQNTLNEVLRTSSPEVTQDIHVQEIYDPGPSTSTAVFEQPVQLGGNAVAKAAGGSEPAENPVEPLNYIKHTQNEDNYFKLRSYTDEFRINPAPNGIASAVWLERAFRDLYNRMMSKVTADTCRVIFKFSAEGMHSPAYCNIMSGNQFPYDQFWQHVETVCQSARVYDALGDVFTLEYSVMTVSGGCAKEGFERYRRNSTYVINNSDNLCFPRSLVVSLYAAKEFSHSSKKTLAEEKLWNEITDARRFAQSNSAIELSIAAGVDVPDSGCGLAEIEKYQDYLAAEEGAVIIVYLCTKDNDETRRFYDGTKRVKELQFEVQYALNIANYVDFNHYEPVRCIHRFINKKYKEWCEVCQKGFTRIRVHRCPQDCPNCLKKMQSVNWKH